MSRWTVVGAEQIIRHVLAPMLGLAGFVYETAVHEGPARWPVISASIALALGQPLAKLFDGWGGSTPEAPPVPEPPARPPSQTDPTGGPL